MICFCYSYYYSQVHIKTGMFIWVFVLYLHRNSKVFSRAPELKWGWNYCRKKRKKKNRNYTFFKGRYLFPFSSYHMRYTSILKSSIVKPWTVDGNTGCIQAWPFTSVPAPKNILHNIFKIPSPFKKWLHLTNSRSTKHKKIMWKFLASHSLSDASSNIDEYCNEADLHLTSNNATNIKSHVFGIFSLIKYSFLLKLKHLYIYFLVL